MIKFILLGIYVFGICLGGFDLYKDYPIYKRFKDTDVFDRWIIIIRIIQLITWPIYWLGNFINYYLKCEPGNYKK